jgi:peroxiredoxin
MPQPPQELPTAASAIRPLLIGATVPPITLTTVEGQAFNLNEALKQKPSVLIFYRGSW